MEHRRGHGLTPRRSEDQPLAAARRRRAQTLPRRTGRPRREGEAVVRRRVPPRAAAPRFARRRRPEAPPRAGLEEPRLRRERHAEVRLASRSPELRLGTNECFPRVPVSGMSPREPLDAEPELGTTGEFA